MHPLALVAPAVLVGAASLSALGADPQARAGVAGLEAARIREASSAREAAPARRLPAGRRSEAAPDGAAADMPPVSRATRGAWRWPLEPPPEVVRRFEPPTSAYGPGHRGADLAAAPGQPVLAVAAGRVAHAGVVAGRGTVTVLHRSGVASTYEPVALEVRAGQDLAAGERIGSTDRALRHCAPRSCLHLGARRGPAYLDPLVLIRGGPVVLLPFRPGRER